MTEVLETSRKPADGLDVPPLEEIEGWPATVDVERGRRPFGLSRSTAYDLVKKGRFPARVIKVGGRYRVVTASIIAVLGQP